jgi:hypothetical protein
MRREPHISPQPVLQTLPLRQRREVPPCSYDLAGDRFGRLVAIRWAGYDNNPFEPRSLRHLIYEATRETALHRVKLQGQP